MNDRPLSPQDIERAITILRRLKGSRASNPADFYKTDKQIVAGMKAPPYSWEDFDSRKLQEYVHWLAANKYPIGSSTSGYYYCETPEDFERSISWSEGRISRISERVRAQKEALEDLKKRSNTLFENPAMKKLTEEFETHQVS